MNLRTTSRLAVIAGLGLVLSILPGNPAVRQATADEPFTFRLATFNVLGDVHTRPYTHDDQFAPSRIRAEWMSDVLTSIGQPDIVGMQEVEAGQLTAIMRATDGAYAAWPGTAVKGGVQQSLMWRTDVWEATSRQTIVIPFIRFKRAQPVVRLRNLATRREIWVINVHNSPRGYQAQRNKDVRIEIAKIKQLRESGLPVFFVGDMNEKATVFCKVVSQTDLFSPMGGSAGPDGCNPPKTRMRIDWIFGSQAVRFDTFRMYDSALKRWTTDHRIPVSKISVP